MSESSVTHLSPELLAAITEPPRRYPPVIPVARIRCDVDDFQVEEIPAYEPEGEGEHLFLWIEKRGLAAAELIDQLARRLQIHSRDIGIAGQKDRHAVTRQYVSVPATCRDRLAAIPSDRLTVLSATAHRNKLRTGHLKGNRFQVIVRTSVFEWSDDEISGLRCRLQQLATAGFPSYFGRQRFGHGGSTLHDGLALLQGRLSRKKWPFHQQRWMTRLVLSAVQSAVFNLIVGVRLAEGQLSNIQAGDVVIRRNGSRPYLVPEDQLETDTADRIPAGPMFGPKMVMSTGIVLQHEMDALAKLGLTGEEFNRFAKLCSGTRRSMLEFPDNVNVDRVDGQPAAVRLTFDLPAGTYATTLLRELATEVLDDLPEPEVEDE